MDAIQPLPLAFGVDGTVRYVTAAVIGVAALALAATAFLQFRRAGTNVPTWQPALALVTDGLYAHSRNPIYIALNLLYLSIAVAAASGWMLASLLPVLLILQFGVILREEEYLEKSLVRPTRTTNRKSAAGFEMALS